MVHTIIEIAYDTSGDDLSLDADEQAYEQVKGDLVAIEHNMNNGIASTLFRVADGVDTDALTTLVDSSASARDWGLVEGTKRGLEIQPGTLTTTELDEYRTKIEEALGEDILAQKPAHSPMNHPYSDLPDDHIGYNAPDWAGPDDEPGAGGPGPTSDGNGPPDKPLYDIMDWDMPSIGEGKWVDLSPELSSPEVVDIGKTSSIGNDEEGEYSSRHRRPFDPTDFL